jgi:hypothetical protein
VSERRSLPIGLVRGDGEPVPVCRAAGCYWSADHVHAGTLEDGVYTAAQGDVLVLGVPVAGALRLALGETLGLHHTWTVA